jgi:hypothetical protein
MMSRLEKFDIARVVDIKNRRQRSEGCFRNRISLVSWNIQEDAVSLSAVGLRNELPCTKYRIGIMKCLIGMVYDEH